MRERESLATAAPARDGRKGASEKKAPVQFRRNQEMVMGERRAVAQQPTLALRKKKYWKMLAWWRGALMESQSTVPGVGGAPEAVAENEEERRPEAKGTAKKSIRISISWLKLWGIDRHNKEEEGTHKKKENREREREHCCCPALATIHRTGSTARWPHPLLLLIFLVFVFLLYTSTFIFTRRGPF